jgi:hypothetical protein
MSQGATVARLSPRRKYYAYSTLKAPDKGEVGGSSPPRPTINPQYLSGYSHFFCLPVSRSKTHLPTICQLSGRADKGRVVKKLERLEMA